MSMSMISIRGSSQLPGIGDDEVTEENSTALEQVLMVLAKSDDRVAIGAQKTAQQLEQFMKQMKERFTKLSEENCKLRVQLIASDSRQRELEVLHKAEIQAITDKVSSAETSVETMRQEMVASARSADARVAATVAAQIEAVKTATQAADARVAAAIQTGDARVAAAIQTGDARVAAAIQTGDARIDAARSAVQQVADNMRAIDEWYAQAPPTLSYGSQAISSNGSYYTRQLQSAIDNCIK
ncbi:MAG: hypothetical protein NTZ67_00020 [Gammaproteobacteria bacterium]|nr:hypothetical protein [Gammaproteobacteria bacterium]